MSSENWFVRTTTGAQTWAPRYVGGTAQDLAGAAVGGAAASAYLNEFEINGGGLLPPYVLMGSALAGIAAAGADLGVEAGDTLDVAGTLAAVRRHPGWNRKRAMEKLERERAMEREILRTVRGETDEPLPAALRIQKPPQKSAAAIAAEMAAQARARGARDRANERAIEAQRARLEIERLQPELAERRRQASWRVVESLLRDL